MLPNHAVCGLLRATAPRHSLWAHHFCYMIHDGFHSQPSSLIGYTYRTRRTYHRRDASTSQNLAAGPPSKPVPKVGNKEKREKQRILSQNSSVRNGTGTKGRRNVKFGMTKIKLGPAPANNPFNWRDHKKPTPEKFGYTLRGSLNALKPELTEAPLLTSLQKEDQERSGRVETPDEVWERFTRTVDSRHPEFLRENEANKVHDRLRSEYLFNGGIPALKARIKYEFYDFLLSKSFSPAELTTLGKVADLRYPSEWFPATRRLKRTVHLHVGPTNSGKTYHALQRLEQAETGVYAGPLRLLAHEVYAKLNAKGKHCALITGEERRNALAEDGSEMTFAEDAIKIRSCTVEMVPLNMNMDVAVLDEIQMIADEHRGWAWTQAFLGLSAKELHLCGEERAVPLIKELCAMIGDEVKIHQYERLSPLQMDKGSIKGDLRQLRKGDAIISFSVMGIHALRREIQEVTGKRAAIVYGTLPPETRAAQARLFNDPDNDYDFLVASDAVGMGLNLAIKRIIFETSYKFNGVSVQRLRVSDIKQIGGRAGRYRVAGQTVDDNASQSDIDTSRTLVTKRKKEADSTGLITTLDSFDFPVVSEAMSSQPEPIRAAGLLPPLSIVERFSRYFPADTPFSYIMARLNELGMTQSRFYLCKLKEQLSIARSIDNIPGLSISDRAIMSAAPIGRMTNWFSGLVSYFAQCVATQQGGGILDIPDFPLELLDEEITGTREQLRRMEELHAGLIIYLWLSYRFAGVFTTRPLASHVKSLVEERIELMLSKMGSVLAQRKEAMDERRRRFLESEQEQAKPDLTSIRGKIEGDDVDMEDPLESNVRFTDEIDIPYIDPVEELQLRSEHDVVNHGSDIEKARGA